MKMVRREWTQSEKTKEEMEEKEENTNRSLKGADNDHRKGR